jgi:hypothetical protein
MRIRIPKKYQARLSKVYLDCAEMLPRFGGGPISTLQLHREHQREDAEDTYQRTRLPEGIKVQYLFFGYLNYSKLRISSNFKNF